MPENDALAGDGARDTSEEDPFSEFESEEFVNGEGINEDGPTPVRESDVARLDDDQDDAAVDTGDGGSGEGSDDDPENEGDAKPKSKQTAQERINEITRLRREAERRAEAAEAELQRVRYSPPQDSHPQSTIERDEEAAEDTAPSPDDFDYGELDPRYIRALASHEARQEFNKLVDRAQKDAAERAILEERAAAQESFKAQIAEGSKKHDDYYEKVVIGAEKGEWPLSEHLGMMLVESDVGDDIAYHLASHPEEAHQVFRQTPLEQARYFGRMEAKFTAGQTAATGEGAEKSVETRTPKAPPPVTPARGSDGKFSPSASTDDFSAFEAHANNQ